jgi:hypothetical protein
MIRHRASRTRDDDERRLRMLEMRERGIKPAVIARALDLTPERVSQTIWEIERDYRRSEEARA